MGAVAGEQSATGSSESMAGKAGSTPFSAQPLFEVPKKLDKVKVVEKEKTEWNTKRLGSRLVVDAACAATAAGSVAPVITMIDKYVRVSTYM